MGIYENILNLNAGLLVFLLAVIVNLFSTLVYKKVTDQKEIKKLKAKQKEMQKEIKKLQSQPEKAMKKQKEMMEISGALMKQSFKPMIYTMVPMLLLFAWINSALIYEPLTPNEPFLVTASFVDGASGEVTLSSNPEGILINEPTIEITDKKAIWTLTGDEGVYFLNIEIAGVNNQKKIEITNDPRYESTVQKYDGALKSIEIANKRVRPLGNFSIFGWNPGMIGTYIIFSLISSIAIRRLMNVA